MMLTRKPVGRAYRLTDAEAGTADHEIGCSFQAHTVADRYKDRAHSVPRSKHDADRLSIIDEFR